MVYVRIGAQQKLARILRQWVANKENRRYASGGNVIGNVISKTFTLGVIGCIGVGTYAAFDSNFRRQVIETVPQTKPVFDAVLGKKWPWEKEGDELLSIPSNAQKIDSGFPAPLFESSATSAASKTKTYAKEDIAQIAEEVFEHKYNQKRKQRHQQLNTTAVASESAFASATAAQKQELSKASFENELKEALDRQKEEQAKHEEEMLRTQRETIGEQHKLELQEAIKRERQEYNKNLSVAVEKIDALESFLNERSEIDGQNRVAKRLWIAGQHLKTTITRSNVDYGNTGAMKSNNRISLLNEIEAIKDASGNDEFVQQLITLVPEKALTVGVCPEDELTERFRKVKNLCRATARIGEDGGNLFQYLLSYVQSIFYWDSFKHTTALTEIDLSNPPTTYDVIARVSYCLKQKDYESVIRLMSLLKGEPSRIASDWVNDARLFLETKQWTEILLAHASVLSIRSLY